MISLPYVARRAKWGKELTMPKGQVAREKKVAREVFTLATRHSTLDTQQNGQPT